jgi:hypothetical protein
MSSLAQKLKSSLFGGILGHGQPATASSAPIRNSRGKGYSSTAPDEWSEQDPMAFGTLRYPDDLGTAEYGHYLLFHIFEVSQSKYAGPQTTPQVGGPPGRTTKRPKEEHNLYSPSIAYEQDDAKLNSVRRETDNKSISGALRAGGKLKRTSDTIALYMPPNLKSSYNANYKKSETGLAGVMGADLIGATNVSEVLDKLGTAGTFATVRDALIDTLAVKAAAGITDLVTGGDLEGVIRKGSQKALNPALEAIFQGVDLRTFDFQFRFTPRSEKELRQVHAIQKLFKFHMLPERVNNQKIGRHLIFPSEFDIQYMYKGVENNWYPFVSGVVLEKMDVTFGPGGETQHFRPIKVGGGEAPAPTEINMTLTFSETEIMTKEKIVEGF